MAVRSRKAKLTRVLSVADPLIAGIHSRLGYENGTVRAICLHGIRTGAEPSLSLPPELQTPLDELKRFVDALLSLGYTFITPSDILRGLNPDSKYILITFDDGYFSTSYAIEAFRTYNVKLTLYVSPYFVCNNIGFFGDIIYREVSRRHPTFAAEIGLNNLAIRRASQGERERFIIDNFGRNALTPAGDEDRPMTISELKDLYALGNVEIGNHTMTHAALNVLSAEQAHQELADAQDVLQAALGVRPTSVAYPFGYYNETTPRVAAECGLRFGLTTDNTAHSTGSLQGEGFQHIGRFGGWKSTLRPDRHLLKIRSSFVASERLVERIDSWSRMFRGKP